MEKSDKKRKILVVDDDPMSLEIMAEIFSKEFNILKANSGKKALEILDLPDLPDLVFLDIQMPDLNGYEVCCRIKSNPLQNKIPVIFVSAMNETFDETRGFEAGAVDYITKPVIVPIVKARAKVHLELKAAREELERQKRTLEQRVFERTADLALTQEVTIQSLAALAETRDNETGNHIIRTQLYVRALAQKVSTDAEFRNFLKPQVIQQIFKSAPLHDIGKVGIPDSILLKPGKLTFDEFEIMKRHVMLGFNAVSKAEKLFSETHKSSFLFFAKEIILTHHEKWNGSGYPKSICGPDIPLSGRLMAVADVYDALISRRVYKPPFSHSQAVEILQEGRGIHFDPKLIDAFLTTQDEFFQIALEYVDSEEDRKFLKSG